MEVQKGNNDVNCFCGIDVSKLTLIGKGRQGRVYFLSEDRVIKVFKKKSFCKDQVFILRHLADSRYFPKLYQYDENSIIMEFINGISMNRYLKYNRLNKKISLELVELINEFKVLEFTRLDIRIAHIFVQTDESLRIIDPRGCFKIVQFYPLLMLRGLREFGALDDFFEFIKDDYTDIYHNWESNWNAGNFKKDE